MRIFGLYSDSPEKIGTLTEGEEPRKFSIKSGEAPPGVCTVIDSFYDQEGRYHTLCSFQWLGMGRVHYRIGFFDVEEGIGNREMLNISEFCLIQGWSYLQDTEDEARRKWEGYKCGVRSQPIPNAVSRRPVTILEATKAEFIALADAQRAEPEHAMLRAQHAMGGGVMSFVIEHVGDLNHRMNESPTWRWAGYEYVHEKIRKTLPVLLHPYGFLKEFEENLRSNAKFFKKDYETHKHEVMAALHDYAEAHKKLPVYNRAHLLARNAAIALGEMRTRDAISALEAIKSHLGSEEEWVAFARQNCDVATVTEDVDDESVEDDTIRCGCGGEALWPVEPVEGIGNREAGWRDAIDDRMWEDYEYHRCMDCGRIINMTTGEVMREPDEWTLEESSNPLRAVQSDLLGPDWLKCPECDTLVSNVYCDEGIGNRRVWTWGYQQGRFEGIAIGCKDCGRIFCAARPYDEIDRTVPVTESKIRVTRDGWICKCGNGDLKWGFQPVQRIEGIGNRQTDEWETIDN